MLKQLLFHPVTILIVTIVSISFFVSLRKNAERDQLSNQNVSVLEQEVDKLASEVEQEKQAVAASQTDLAKEKIMRNELLMQKPGEYVVQLPSFINAETPQEATPEPTKKPLEEWRWVLFGK